MDTGPIFVLYLVFLTLSIRAVQSDILTVGNQMGHGFESRDRYPASWLDLGTYLPSSVVIRWRLYCQVPYRPIRLQIWRPMPPSGRYLLLAEHRVVPTSVGIVEYELSPRHRVPVQAGDILGFTLESDVSPVPYYTSSETRNLIGSLRSHVMHTSTMLYPMPGNVYAFNMSEIFHREYSVNVDVGFAYIWIGVQYDNLTEAFVWVDDSRSLVKDPSWSAGEPSTTLACTSLTVRGEWDMKNCSYKSFYICQAKESFYRQTPPTVDTTTAVATSTRSGHDALVTSWMSAPQPEDCNMKSSGRLCSKIDTHITESVGRNALDPTTLDLFKASTVFPKDNVTSSDIFHLTEVISRLARTRLSDQTHNISDMSRYLQTVARGASLILGEDCQCSEAWKQVMAANLSDSLIPMSVVEDVESIVKDVLEYAVNRSTLASIRASDHGIDIHIEVMPKDNIDNEFVLHKTDEQLKVIIPKDIFSDERAALALIVYNSLDQIIDNTTTQQLYGITGSETLASHVISIALYPAPEFREGSWIQFMLNNKMDLQPGAVPLCSYWSHSRLDGGQWKQDGCELVNWTVNSTTCRCRHLTNFAILVQLYPVQIAASHRVALSIITYVGCGLSILGSLATMLLHLAARCFTERAKILINLSLALFVAHGTFVVGVTMTEYKEMCKLIAVVLHYFFMASFFWMLAQGIALYVKVKVIFKTQSKFVHYCLLGWGMPAIIVAVAVGTRYEDYGNSNYCWLSMQTGLMWSFVGPIIVIASVNFFILCMLMKSFGQTKYRTESPGTKESNTLRSSARAAIVMLPVLGLTWIFGLLSVNKETVVFQYLFGVCNSTQGFAIFLLHCVFNDEIRASWHRQLQGSSLSAACSPRDPPIDGADLNVPKGILKRTPSNTSTTSTKSVTLRQSPESVSPDLWDVESSHDRFSFGCLIPGRSKVIPITDPKVNRIKSSQHTKQNGDCSSLY